MYNKKFIGKHILPKKNGKTRGSKLNPTKGELSIYIHWPFCQSLCPYCDFNSYVSKKLDMHSWSKAYKRAIEISKNQTDAKVINSIYFGGGTPSLMSPKLISDIINQIDRNFKLASDIEITLEANPSSAEYSNFKSYSSSGVNRCSLGIQSLRQKDLKKLGRLHSVEEALKAYEVARFIFKSSSFDLIYGRQNQTIREWENELVNALDLKPQHISLYQLTIEPKTPFYLLQQKNRLPGLPSSGKSCSFYNKTKEICEKNKLIHYEISNYAIQGHQCIHNLNYWRYGDFLGIGPGAFGRITLDNQKYETESEKNPKKWLETVLSEKENIYSKIRALSSIDQAKEYALMSFRLKEGMNIDRYNSFSTAKLLETKIEELAEEGLLNISGNYLSTTDKGELLLNSILSQLLN